MGLGPRLGFFWGVVVAFAIAVVLVYVGYHVGVNQPGKEIVLLPTDGGAWNCVFRKAAHE